MRIRTIVRRVSAILLASFVGFISCKGPGNTDEVEKVELQGTVIVPDTGYLGCFRPFMMGDRFVTEFSSGDFMTYAGKLDGDTLRSGVWFAKRGQGPKEFIELSLAAGSDTTLYAMNGSMGHPLSVVRIPMNPFPDAGMSDWKEFRIDSLDFMSSVPWVILSDSTALVNSGSWSTNNLFSVLDFKNATVREISWTPDDGVEMEDPSAKQMVYATNGFLYRNTDRFLYVSGAGAYSIIFTLDGSGLRILNTLKDVYPDYSQAEDGINYALRRTTDELRGASNSSHIYLLNVDKGPDGEEPQLPLGPVRGNVVHVYDWNGKHVKDYVLDRLVRYIFASDDDGILYARSVNNETGELDIIKYDLGEDHSTIAL